MDLSDDAVNIFPTYCEERFANDAVDNKSNKSYKDNRETIFRSTLLLRHLHPRTSTLSVTFITSH
jgi:hypothetical protein